MNIVYMFLSEPEKIVWKWLTKRSIDFEVLKRCGVDGQRKVEL